MMNCAGGWDTVVRSALTSDPGLAGLQLKVTCSLWGFGTIPSLICTHSKALIAAVTIRSERSDCYFVVRSG